MQGNHLPSTVTGTRINLEKVNLIYCHSKQISIVGGKKRQNQTPFPTVFTVSPSLLTHLLPNSKSVQNVWILKSPSIHNNSLLLLPPPIFPVFTTQPLSQATSPVWTVLNDCSSGSALEWGLSTGHSPSK